jgi:uncharacterized protein with von Willebrand factor type A (vWA) domain
MEAQIHVVDAEIARIEGLFASPDFHRTQATETNQLTADLAAAKENLAKLYARWEELEAVRAAAEKQQGEGLHARYSEATLIICRNTLWANRRWHKMNAPEQAALRNLLLEISPAGLGLWLAFL